MPDTTFIDYERCPRCGEVLPDSPRFDSISGSGVEYCSPQCMLEAVYIDDVEKGMVYD